MSPVFVFSSPPPPPSRGSRYSIYRPRPRHFATAPAGSWEHLIVHVSTRYHDTLLCHISPGEPLRVIQSRLAQPRVISVIIIVIIIIVVIVIPLDPRCDDNDDAVVNCDDGNRPSCLGDHAG